MWHQRDDGRHRRRYVIEKRGCPSQTFSFDFFRKFPMRIDAISSMISDIQGMREGDPCLTWRIEHKKVCCYLGTVHTDKCYLFVAPENLFRYEYTEPQWITNRTHTSLIIYTHIVVNKRNRLFIYTPHNLQKPTRTRRVHSQAPHARVAVQFALFFAWNRYAPSCRRSDQRCDDYERLWSEKSHCCTSVTLISDRND